MGIPDDVIEYAITEENRQSDKVKSLKPSCEMKQTIHEWTKQNLWKTAFKKFVVVWSV